MEKTQYYGTGKRKTSTARVFLMPGTGQIVVNRMDFKEYFKSKVQHVMVTQPLVLTDHSEEFDVYINVRGEALRDRPAQPAWALPGPY